MAMGPTELIIIIFIGALLILPFWKIYSRLGYPGALSLTQLIPLVGSVVLIYVAFAEWPIERKHKGLS